MSTMTLDIATAILLELRSRAGLDDLFAQCDRETIAEIKESIAYIIDAHLTSREANGDDATETLLSYKSNLYLDPDNEDCEELALVCGFSVDDKHGRKAYFHAVDGEGNHVVLQRANSAAQEAAKPVGEVDDSRVSEAQRKAVASGAPSHDEHGRLYLRTRAESEAMFRSGAFDPR